MSDRLMLLATTRERMKAIEARIRFIHNELAILMVEIVALQAQLGSKIEPAATDQER